MKFDFSPSKEFGKKAKERFLAAFDARYPTPAATLPARPSEFILAMRSLAIVLAAAAIVFGGASVYADTANVPADNLLYPLKRLSESVQLALTVPAAKPQLEASLAARRAGEITDLAARNPTSTILPSLTSDLTRAVDTSIRSAAANMEANNARNNVRPQINEPAPTSSSPQPSNEHGSVTAVCSTLRSFLNPSSSIVERDLLGRSDAMQNFDEHCGGNPEDGSVITTTTSSTTPSIATSTPIRFPGRGRSEEEDGSGRNATTTPGAMPGTLFRSHEREDATSSLDERHDF